MGKTKKNQIRPNIELIMPNENNFTIFTDVQNTNDNNEEYKYTRVTENEMKNLISKYLKFGDNNKIDFIVSDLHNVLDTTVNKVLPVSNRLIALSYVGYRTKTYYIAIKDICERIKSGQILFGILCFKKTDKAGLVGSKEYIIKNLIHSNKFNKIYFLDDSADNILSVASSEVKINTIKINKNDNVENILSSL